MHPIHEEEIMVLGTPLVDAQEFCAVRDHTKKRGCLSHPQAREYLNGDVIGELEEWKISYLTDLSTGKDYVEIDVEKIDATLALLHGEQQNGGERR